MTTILLIIIYIAFISLGLPDSLIGVVWPSVQVDWGLSLDSAGLVSAFIVAATVLSSFLSGYFIKKFSTGKIVFISGLMTGTALFGFSIAPSYVWLLLLAIPLGLGAGSVDAALNNYVALHFKSHHMNWLHSFWGLGATLGPVIMGRTLANGISWQGGFRTISIIQLILAGILFISMPLWAKHKRINKVEASDKNTEHKLVDLEAFRIEGVKYALVTFAFYCAAELSIGLWGSSFLVHTKNISVDIAAYWIALYYASITAGRFISGFISLKVSNKNMIRYGSVLALVGVILMILPLPKSIALLPFILIGLGLAPIFPAMIHETPSRFGKEKSQTIIGYQMAFAYTGNLLFPPLFGVIIDNITVTLFPMLVLGCVILVMISSERINRIIKKDKA